ncbi:hypothetical protein [uncultured Deefgea sp.]|nr:hypothetical protein [uncultured Deefgea sp.]
MFEFNQQAIALYQELGFAVRVLAMSKSLLTQATHTMEATPA